MNDTDGPDESTGGLPDENPNRPREYHGARTVLAGVGVVIAVAAALWLALLRPSSGGDGGVVALPAWLPTQGVEVGDRIGQLAPDFDLETLDGDRFRLSDWRGQPVLINFWASWCGPCRREVPALIRALDAHADTGFIVVGVNIEESTDVARNFASEFGIDFVLPMDYDGAVFRAYGGGGPNGPPRTMFVNPEGVIVRIWSGQAPDDVVERDTLDFASAYATNRVGMLPGVKSPPPIEGADEAAIAVAEGAIAPDLLLQPRDAADDLWRLSDYRGATRQLAFAPPGCMRCARDLGVDFDPTQGAILLLEDDQDTQPRLFNWNADVGRIFATDGDLQLISVDAKGVIARVAHTLESTE